MKINLLGTGILSLCGATLFVAGLMVGHFAIWRTSGSADALYHVPPSLSECYQQVLDRSGVKTADIKTQTDIRDLCVLVIGAQASLNDFELRRIGVFAQFYQGQVVLWMVVAITVSGVILAGIQLLIGFSFARKSALREGVKSNESRAADKLNASDPDGVSKIEYGKGGLIVQSSVTGLLILIVSFAFFYVFVTKIYSISENTSPQSSVVPAQTPTLFPGGAGHVIEKPQTGSPVTPPAPAAGSK